MSMFLFSHSYTEEIPTIAGVIDEISNVVGLSEIKSQLKGIVKNIRDAERNASLGLRVVPPKPFHMFFLGNSGTGKSTVARIIGKLFYLAGVLPSYHVTEFQGSRRNVEPIEDAIGGTLLVNVDEPNLNQEVVAAILLAMNDGDTAVIFAGEHKTINRCMSSNKELFSKFSLTLQFNDLSCKDLAMILEAKMKNNDNQEEDSAMCGLKMHSSCCVDMVGKVIAEETTEKVREKLNSYLVDSILIEAKQNLERRINFEDGMVDIDRRTITMQDLKAGICYTSSVFQKQFCL